MRIAKMANAYEAIGEIRKGQDIYILTFGQFSLVDALVSILDQTGPAHVVISTWTAADAHLEHSAELVESADMLSLKMILDRSFETRQPQYVYHMKKLFGTECIRYIKSHAKFMLIRNAQYNIVVRTSMNLNENPRLENIEISESKEFADFFQAIVDDIFANEDLNHQGKEKPPDLASIQETFPFQEIEAQQIERHSLNEPQTSHTIKKS